MLGSTQCEHTKDDYGKGDGEGQPTSDAACTIARAHCDVLLCRSPVGGHQAAIGSISMKLGSELVRPNCLE